MSENSSFQNYARQAVLGLAPGAVGGVCNVLVGHPIDLVKVRMQTATTVIATPTTASAASSSTVSGVAARAAPATATPGLIPVVRNLVLHEGITGMYAGVAAPLVAVVPAFAVVFGTYEAATSMQLAYNQKLYDAGSISDASLSKTQIALAGAATGVPLGLVLGPLERIKCLLQIQSSSNSNSTSKRYSNFIDCVRQLYREGGLRSLLRGTGLTVLRDVPGNAAYFGTYEITREAMLGTSYQQQPQKPSSAMVWFATFWAGGLAGVANWVVAIPVDVVKSRYQTAPDGVQVRQIVQDLFRHEGFGAFTKGIAPALLRAFPANAACLVGVETTRGLLGISNNR